MRFPSKQGGTSTPLMMTRRSTSNSRTKIKVAIIAMNNAVEQVFPVKTH